MKMQSSNLTAEDWEKADKLFKGWRNKLGKDKKMKRFKEKFCQDLRKDPWSKSKNEAEVGFLQLVQVFSQFSVFCTTFRQVSRVL